VIDELKTEVERTLGRRILTRGDCELLCDDLYQKTGAVLSYNTFRRLFGIIEYRKPRENTLDALSLYIGFQSYQDFTKRFSEVDTWPLWEHLFVVLSEADTQSILTFLHVRKRQQNQFTITFTIVVRELLSRRDLSTLLLIFRDPMFQFSALPYDEVAQIGVLIGLHFREFHDRELEEVLLLEPNFRDLVLKIFVDYGRLNSKYGEWVTYLSGVKDLDKETADFLTCLQIWRDLLNNKQPIDSNKLKQLPNLETAQHPILFGRLNGLKILTTKNKKSLQKLKQQMEQRIEKEPHYVTELLYEPAVQALVLNSELHEQILAAHKHQINQINFWYHMSQVAIHRVLQVKLSLREGQFQLAKSILENIPYGHIRHGYREFIELYVAFFRWYIAKSLNEDTSELELEFNWRRTRLNYPILDRLYFEKYFDAY
jgi:hypothetical protein